jgi:hypothetical protein
MLLTLIALLATPGFADDGVEVGCQSGRVLVPCGSSGPTGYRDPEAARRRAEARARAQEKAARMRRYNTSENTARDARKAAGKRIRQMFKDFGAGGKGAAATPSTESVPVGGGMLMGAAPNPSEAHRVMSGVLLERPIGPIHKTTVSPRGLSEADILLRQLLRMGGSDAHKRYIAEQATALMSGQASRVFVTVDPGSGEATPQEINEAADVGATLDGINLLQKTIRKSENERIVVAQDIAAKARKLETNKAALSKASGKRAAKLSKEIEKLNKQLDKLGETYYKLKTGEKWAGKKIDKEAATIKR